MAQIPRVNYDVLALTYDQRTKHGYLSEIESALKNLAQELKARQVLDIGCGTGRSLYGLSRNLEPPPLCFGLDFSAGMLAKARILDPTLRLVRASATSLPYLPSSFDFVFSVHAFHHFPNKQGVVEAIYEILRPGGAFAIVGVDPRESDHRDFIYEYFEGTYATDLQRFSSMMDQMSMLQRAGFQGVRSPVVQHIKDDLQGEKIFESYFLRKDACSQLALLSEEVYQAGLDRIREKVEGAKAKGGKAIFSIHYKNRMYYGFKPT
jgi:ubiquinone/menaquinone biosynthesis C-methylase UbiE